MNEEPKAVEDRLHSINTALARVESNLGHAVTYKQLLCGVIATVIAIGGVVYFVVGWHITDSLSRFNHILEDRVAETSTRLAEGAADEIAALVGEEVRLVEERLVTAFAEAFLALRGDIEALPESIIEARVPENVSQEISALSRQLGTLEAGLSRLYGVSDFATVASMQPGEAIIGQPFQVYTWTGPAPDVLIDQVGNIPLEEVIERGYLSPSIVQPIEVGPGGFQQTQPD
jgi:hypothetical protein